MDIEKADEKDWIKLEPSLYDQEESRTHPSGPKRTSPHPYRARVLIVDDDAMNQVALEGMLTSMGHVVAGMASNGLDAVEMYKQLSPDVVLMDIVMPFMDGIEATRRILDLDWNAKILMVSVMGERHTMEKALAAGAKGFVVKPFRSARLDEKIVKVLIGSREHQLNK